MSQIDLKALSKTMAHALRHDPAAHGITLDEAGWTSVEALLSAIKRKRRFRGVQAADFQRVIDASDKPRYEMAEGRIRARYGHSLDQKITHQPTTPPDVLYHGTPQEAVSVILREGLKPMNRQYVHLSADIATATQVGARRGKPVILMVQALSAHAEGVAFYHSHDMIWLCDAVPPKYIQKMD